jgi:hypothetical protein
MARSDRNAVIYRTAESRGYDLICSGQAMFVAFASPPAINRRPFRIGNVAVLTPGDRFTAIGNDRKRSAGWTYFEFHAPGFVEFVGSFEDTERQPILLFDQWKGPDERAPLSGPKEFAAFYWALYPLGDQLCTVTAGNASRLIPPHFVKL